MKKTLNRLINHEKIGEEEAKQVLINISRGDYSPEQIASFLTVYMMRSITVEELQGFYDTLSPDVIVKGSEWTADEVRERDNIPENVQIKVYPLVGDYSTTNTMNKIRDMETCEKI